MGNYSRDTFDKNKNYVAVRLQQGVPLVDADWNEFNDITRHELYDGLGTAFSDGVNVGSTDLKLEYENDLLMSIGSVLIKGRPLRVRTKVYYTTQSWTDLNRAKQDGVVVIPPLTTPKADRQDIVYLDVWEREVDPTDDTDLINSAIGIETCVRLKREVALRVAEGRTTLPPASSGHFFMPIALLNRKAGKAKIYPSDIVDIRPFLHSTKGTREASFLPNFLPFSFDTMDLDQPWKIDSNGGTDKFYAYKPYRNAGAYGVLSLVLPDGAHIYRFKYRGNTGGSVRFQLIRIKHQYGKDSAFVNALVDVTVRKLNSSTRTFDSSIEVSSIDRKNIVDNSRYYYSLVATASGRNSNTMIHGISIQYGY